MTDKELDYINRIAEEEDIKPTIVYCRYWRGERNERRLRKQPYEREQIFCGKTNKEWVEWMKGHGRALPYATFMGMKYRNKRNGLGSEESLIQILINMRLLRTFLIEQGKEDVLDVFS